MSTVDLSSINRAAMSAKEGYWWINLAGLALSLLIAKMSFTAYGASGIEGAIDKAWICVTCQALAIALAILARRAFTGQMFVEGLVAGAAAAGCAWWASHGLALAWAAGGDPANAWMVFFLTALEPGMFLLAEQVKEGRDSIRTAQAKADREDAEALAAARAKDEANRQKSPDQPADARATGETARIYRFQPAETARQPVDQPGEAVEAGEKSATARATGDLPADLPGEPGEVLTAARLAGDTVTQQPHDAHTFANAEDHARHLISVEGVTKRNELARRVRGLTTYRATRLLDELSPGWRVTKRSSAA